MTRRGLFGVSSLLRESIVKSCSLTSFLRASGLNVADKSSNLGRRDANSYIAAVNSHFIQTETRSREGNDRCGNSSARRFQISANSRAFAERSNVENARRVFWRLRLSFSPLAVDRGEVLEPCLARSLTTRSHSIEKDSEKDETDAFPDDGRQICHQDRLALPKFPAGCW